MDILEPETVWLNGRCYRFCDSSVWTSQEKSNKPYKEEFCHKSEEINMLNDHDDDFIIKPAGDGKFKHSFIVSERFFGFIIGTRASMKTKLEAETKTKIHIPDKNSQDKMIVILGSTRDNIISCRHRIDLLIESCRKKLRPTHFISIPLNNNESIVKKFNEFRSQILSNPAVKSQGIEESFFVSEHKLHITIGLLLLLDDKEKKDAMECLGECVQEVVKPILAKCNQDIIFKVKGINGFTRSDAKKMNVLYAQILPNEVFQEIANGINDYFVKKGLMHGSKSSQLHMTLLKNSHGRDKKECSYSPFPTFNATQLIEDYQDFVFGEATLDTLLISEISTESENKNYETLCQIDLTAK